MHWRFQLAGLSDRFRVIAWNAPGYMLTDAFAKDTPDCKDYADALGDFLAALKLERVSIVANSFGTRVAHGLIRSMNSLGAAAPDGIKPPGYSGRWRGSEPPSRHLEAGRVAALRD